MSGILIPGQENKPQPSGGIEIAKGYSRQEEENESASGPAPDTTSENQPIEEVAPVEAEPPERRDGDIDIRYPPMPQQAQCPNCNTPFGVAVFSVIDLGVNPELKMPLLGGQINVASCPQCGAGGPLSLPLMVHSPENEFLGVFIPPMGQANDMQQQRVIGDLTQTLMRKMPTEEKKGYMLQPQPFMDWMRFTEKLWGFEGVTPEMLQRQRDQQGAIQQLMSLANDPAALDIAIERHKSLIDRDFFNMFQRILSSVQGQQGAEAIVSLYEKLVDQTEAGAEVKAQQEKITGYLERLGSQPTQEELLDVMVEGWQDEVDGREIVGTLGMMAGQALDYQFLVMLSERVEETEDEAEKEQLNGLRDYVVAMQEQQRQAAEAMIQQVQGMLQQVLQSEKPMDTLREIAPYINDTFLGVVAANVQEAEKQNATAAANRFRAIYQMAVQVVQESMPEDARLLNQLVMMEESDLRQYLKENHHQITPEFMETMQKTEEQMRLQGQAQIADRIKSVRGRIALMR